MRRYRKGGAQLPHAIAQHFRRDGRAKVGYPAEADAIAFINGRDYRAYRCAFCKQWHVAVGQ